jgi:hypothetical protein
MTPNTIRATAVMSGCALVSTGAGMIYTPAGLIVGGTLMLVMGLIGHIRSGDK